MSSIFVDYFDNILWYLDVLGTYSLYVDLDWLYHLPPFFCTYLGHIVHLFICTMVNNTVKDLILLHSFLRYQGLFSKTCYWSGLVWSWQCLVLCFICIFALFIGNRSSCSSGWLWIYFRRHLLQVLHFKHTASLVCLNLSLVHKIQAKICKSSNRQLCAQLIYSTGCSQIWSSSYFMSKFLFTLGIWYYLIFKLFYN